MKFIDFEGLKIEELKLLDYIHTRKLTRLECIILLSKLKSSYESFAVYELCKDMIDKKNEISN